MCNQNDSESEGFDKTQVTAVAGDLGSESENGANHNISVGKSGEDLAVQMLLDHGWTIVDRNWRCREGEVDIVANKGNHLALVEVKTRSSLAFGSGAEAISAQKLKRMRIVGTQWLRASCKSWSFVSLDVIEISLREHQPALIRFIRSVG